MTSRKRSKNGGDDGTGVYIREGTTSRVTAADRPYGEFYDFYGVSPENFGSTLVQFFGQPDDGLHVGPKHVVVYYIMLLILQYFCVHDCMYIQIYTHYRFVLFPLHFSSHISP